MNIKFLSLLGSAGVFLAAIAKDDLSYTPSSTQTVTPRPYALKPVESEVSRSQATPLEKPSATTRILYVSGSVVNVREGPTTNYQRLFQLKNGETVREIARSNGWVKILANGRVGWMHGDYLQPFRTAAKPKPKTIKTTAKKQPNPRCDPKYAGACVPIASDVDCSSGRGNGPAYVRGPVRVIGRDIYRLDGDGDGIGCERG